MKANPNVNACDARLLLTAGLNQLDLELTEGQIDQLVQYLYLIQKWNTRYNLTAIRDIKQMVIRHVLDALTVVPYLQSKKTIDLGSGVGVPGIILGIVWPETQLVLVDSSMKKTSFLRQVKSELSLSNVRVLTQRIEQLDSSVSELSDIQQVVNRALAPLSTMLNWSHGLLTSHVVFFAMKGKLCSSEVSAIPLGLKASRIIAIRVPFLNEETRHLVEVRSEGT